MQIPHNETWLPPDTSFIEFRDCEVVTDWALDFFTSADLPIVATIRLIQDGLGEFWRNNNITQPNDFDVLPWALNSGEPLYIQTLNWTNQQCQTQFCQKLPWEGNADLAGRGMVVNYYIQCALVTIYMGFHMAARFGWTPPHRTIGHRFLSAIQESTRPFLDAALLFSIAIHSSASLTFIRGRVDANKPTPTTAAVCSAFVALFSVFAPLTLHSCAEEHLRRKHGRRRMWMYLCMLMFIVVGLYFSDPQSPWLREWPDWNAAETYRSNNETGLYGLLWRDEDHQLTWESFCVMERGANRANWAIVVALATLITFFTLYWILMANVFKLGFLHSERRPMLAKVRRHRWTILTLLAFKAMWICLGIFFWFRDELNEHAGQMNKDRQWTFGQILAVTTWTPVVMEFYIIWWSGAEKGLTGLMTDRYVVVKTGSTYGQEENKEPTAPVDEEEGRKASSASLPS
ncbi:hypothetical protein K458DRAFT_426318 [Lentithecium fluviatile CBS 122367]|uniref:Integral membrane protein n=1 Tax=Lentithecium fluviatile CBS 122367 TaxID=1168545 RepID=A0A6G1JL75_9PLEO|nr:hypothetical protein K458DRAFT_426318 [Lentithecium fluviatile CBS 122367]